METMLSQIEDEHSTAEAVLEGFAYGEFLDGPQQRSLGFRLLAPQGTPWFAEVEALARRLQATVYPDDWPIVDLFCSVLLSDGRRLAAIARYGLTDRTPSRRRGGLELFGVVGPASLSLPAVLAIDQWLRQRRAGVEPIESLAVSYDLVDVLAEAPALPLLEDRGSYSPLGLERAIILAAVNANEPDTRLGMLTHLNEKAWQWLPFVPHDFPLSDFAERGPIIAWSTPAAEPVHPAKPLLPSLDPAPRLKSGRGWMAFLTTLLAGLLGANAWYLWRLDERLAEWKPPSAVTAPQENPSTKTVSAAPPAKEISANENEVLAQALYQHLRGRGCIPENRRDLLLKNYERLAAADDGLRVGSLEGRLALGALSELTRRKSPAQIEAIIRGISGDKKGIDDRVLELIAERVFLRLTEE